MDEKHFLDRDARDRSKRASTLVSNALSGVCMERPAAYEVFEEWIDDEAELSRALDILTDGLGDDDAGTRPEECSGFMRVLSDERRLLRDTDRMMSGHKWRMLRAFSAAYEKLYSQ